ncbi:MAG: hypothetical protein H7Y27_01135 [Gemmatimonadaceae bacterium]|nr:hypothetical protein [Chitinophagaceae bacterium]
METQEPKNDTVKSHPEGRIAAGIFLLAIGIVWILAKADLILLPEWIFTWPMIPIMFGILSGIKHKFRGGGWFPVLLLGTFFLLDENMPGWDVKRYLIPMIIIVIGLFLLMKPKRFMGSPCMNSRRHRGIWRRQWNDANGGESGSPDNLTQTGTGSNEDVIDSLSVFGGVRKVVLSKNFRGGEITSVMGGTEVDFSQADIQSIATLEVTSVMGATKLIIPPHWSIKSDVTAVFGALEDKRNVQGVVFDPNKILVLKGVSFLGGLEITSY